MTTGELIKNLMDLDKDLKRSTDGTLLSTVIKIWIEEKLIIRDIRDLRISCNGQVWLRAKRTKEKE